MRLIDADKLKKAISWFGHHETKDITVRNVMSVIDEQPTVDAKPVVHGKDRCDEYEGHCEFWCSECGYFLYEVIPRGCVDDCDRDCDCDGDFNYCPNCGADIREDVD